MMKVVYEYIQASTLWFLSAGPGFF